ncbi:hypothetical protein M622_06180 [Thauera terpenica 58Eu]|uniref:Uncharacterized protein n=1 Tax=Thauera terpenica 58Eu TaxID=1348657 RepID=T0AU50_9RHOO|nr:hypothetical protein M622_06180 [Thauera terpenica 58Eu]
MLMLSLFYRNPIQACLPIRGKQSQHLFAGQMVPVLLLRVAHL